MKREILLISLLGLTVAHVHAMKIKDDSNDKTKEALVVSKENEKSVEKDKQTKNVIDDSGNGGDDSTCVIS